MGEYSIKLPSSPELESMNELWWAFAEVAVEDGYICVGYDAALLIGIQQYRSEWGAEDMKFYLNEMYC